VVYMLIYCLSLGSCLGVALMNIPPALDVLMAHFRVNYLGISFLITALLWTHALCQLPGGMAADRWGVKPILG
jgi:MFS family permease